MAQLLSTVRGGQDYVAILAYLPMDPDVEERLQRLRLRIGHATGAATTLGFGPRFLHSTGQLHKGGANTGVFIQVVDRTRSTDLSIPGRPYSFGMLIDAQAFGDLRSLRERGRRVARVTLDALMEAI